MSLKHRKEHGFGMAPLSRFFDEKCPSELPKVSFGAPLGYPVAPFGRLWPAMCDNCAEACSTVSLTCDFHRFCVPGAPPGFSRRPASGVLWGLGQTACSPPGEMFLLGEAAIEQNGCGVAPAVVTKVTYCTLQGGFTASAGDPTYRRRHSGKPRAAADLRSTPPAAGSWM